MKYALLALPFALAACPGDDGDTTNGETLWLAPDGAETRVRLVDRRPAPF